MLARAAPATERQAQSLLQFLTRRPGLRKLVRQLDVSEIWAVADDRVSLGHRLFARSSRRRVPPTEKQIWDLVTMVGPHLGDITVAVQRGDEFMLDEARISRTYDEWREEWLEVARGNSDAWEDLEQYRRRTLSICLRPFYTR